MPRLSHGKGEGAAGTRLRCGTLLFGSVFPASAHPPLRSSSASCPPRRAAPLRPAALPVPQTRGPNPAQPPGRSRRVPSEHLFLPVSQNHSMVGVGRDLCGSPSPTPCRSRVTQSRLHSTLSPPPPLLWSHRPPRCRALRLPSWARGPAVPPERSARGSG